MNRRTAVVDLHSMPLSNAARCEGGSMTAAKNPRPDSSSSSAATPRESREWDHRPTIMHPISAPPAPLPGNGLVRARARIPAPRRSPKAPAPASDGTATSQPSLRSLNLLTPSGASHPVPHHRVLSARKTPSSPPSISPRETREWDSNSSVHQPIGSPASPLPEVAPQRDAVTFALWTILAGQRTVLTSHDFYLGMQKLFPGEMHIAVQELWVTMSRSLGGYVQQQQFQAFFEKTRPDFLFGQEKKYKLLLPVIHSKKPPIAHAVGSGEHRHRADLRSGEVPALDTGSVSPPRYSQREHHGQEHASEESEWSPDRVPASGAAAVTPADASVRAREHLSQEADFTWPPQVHAQMGFLPVVLPTPRGSRAATPAQSKTPKDKACSPKDTKPGRHAVRLQQYLSWMRTVLPLEDHEHIGSDGSGLCSGLLLFKLLKAVGAPAERLQALHLQMDQSGRTRRLWLRNMQAVANCVLACSSTVCALEPELAVDGDPGALAAFLRLIVQTFVVKKISKTRVMAWCAAHLQLLNAPLQPQSVQPPYSPASLHHDFGDGLLLSLLLQRCIPAAEEAVRSEAILLLQESDLHSNCYSNRHVALALIVTLGLHPYFTLQQLELKPVECNFLWMQLNAIHLAFGASLPAPETRAAVAQAQPHHTARDQAAKQSGYKEQESHLKAAIQEKRAVEAKSAELQLSKKRLDSMQRTLRVLTSPRNQNTSDMLQLAKQTHAQLQERSEELEDTSSEIVSVKQALAAVLQQQQEVQCLVQEHSALKSRQDTDESHGDEQPAHTFQSFLEKIQLATLLENTYTHRANLLRAAAETLRPGSNQATPTDPATQESIDKIQADLHEMERFYIQKSGPDTSASFQLLIDAKRSQLQELLSLGRRQLQPEDFQHFQTLLSSDHSLQEAFDREAHAAHELEQLKQQESIRDYPTQQRYVSTRGTPSSKEAGIGPKSRRSGLRVQFSDTEQHNDGADTETQQQLKVYSAELVAIQRLIQCKQTEGDDNAVRTLKHILQRKQARVLSLPVSKPEHLSQVHTNAASNQISDAQFFILNFINSGERSVSLSDATAWRMFWQSLQAEVAEDIICGSCQDSDAADDPAGVTFQDAMAKISNALERSQSQRKFFFLFISCPISSSEPAALQLGNGQHLSFDYLHRWLGSLRCHQCLLVFDTGGSPPAQTAIDASRVSNFSGSIISGCMGRVHAGVLCNSKHPLRCSIGSEMGLLSFAIIEALLSANSNLTCDELEQVLCSIQSQRFLDPSIISTLPVVVPSWAMTPQHYQHKKSAIDRAPQTRALHISSSPILNHPSSAAPAEGPAVGYTGDSGITSIRQTLETQYPPVSPEGSPIHFSPNYNPSLPQTILAFSDDDDVTPSAAWRL